MMGYRLMGMTDSGNSDRRVVWMLLIVTLMIVTQSGLRRAVVCGVCAMFLRIPNLMKDSGVPKNLSISKVMEGNVATTSVCAKMTPQARRTCYVLQDEEE